MKEPTGLSRWEQETIITFNKGKDLATIYTYEKTWMKRLEALGLKPIAENSHGARTYQIDKHRIRVPTLARKLPEARAKAAAERLRQYRTRAKTE